jgi:hypothetical protein
VTRKLSGVFVCVFVRRFMPLITVLVLQLNCDAVADAEVRADAGTLNCQCVLVLMIPNY